MTRPDFFPGPWQTKPRTGLILARDGTHATRADDLLRHPAAAFLFISRRRARRSPRAEPPPRGPPETLRRLVADPDFDELSPPPWPAGLRTPLAEAGRALADWRIQLAGVSIDGPRLLEITAGNENRGGSADPISRIPRSSGRPVVRMDLIHLLDDILREGRRGLRGQRVWITPGRTRSRGILLHPDDIFEGNPCRYGERGFLEIDEPRAQVDLPPARDGDPPGPAWAMCNRNSSGETELLGVLGEKRSGDDPGPRIRSLIE